VRQLDAALERRGLTRRVNGRPVKPGHRKAVSSHRSPNEDADENAPNQASQARVRPVGSLSLLTDVLPIKNDLNHNAIGNTLST
jgi:hypothetical protein